MTLSKLMTGSGDDHEIARSRILSALLATRGNAVKAAKLLSCSHRSLCRYVARLEMHANVEAVRRASKKK